MPIFIYLFFFLNKRQQQKNAPPYKYPHAYRCQENIHVGKTTQKCMYTDKFAWLKVQAVKVLIRVYFVSLKQSKLAYNLLESSKASSFN